jgi:hypothetical protein
MTIKQLAGLATSAIAVAATAVAIQPAAQADPLPYGPDTCIQGYVWREARTGDTVCVTPNVRSQVAQQNANPSANKDPNGAYGPESCAQGFVWREAFDGDTICVTPAIRSSTKADNAAANSRKQANQPQPTPSALPTPDPIPTPASTEPSTVTFEIYAKRPGVEVAEVDIDTLDRKFGKTQLPFAQTVPLPSPVKSLRLRAYGYGQDQIGCRITVNGTQVLDIMNSPVAICSWKA